MALGRDQFQTAEQLLGRVLEQAPDSAEAHRLMGIVCLMTMRRSQAIGHLRKAREFNPDDAAINMTLGSVLVETGDVEAGLSCLEQACALADDSPVAWCNLGVAYESVQRMEPARGAFERAVAADPDYLKARHKLATAQLTLGDAAGAARTLRDTLDRRPDDAEAWTILGNVKTERLNADDLACLQDLLRRPGLSTDARIRLGFTLAKALEDGADYMAAFDALTKANVLKRRQVRWDRGEERARVEVMARTFAQPLASSATDATLGKEIILVTCVPRSGSTLTEQILASHPQVQAGGETMKLIDVLAEESDRQGRPVMEWMRAATSADWQRMGEDYLGRVRGLRGEYPRLTDKSVDNWAYVGAAMAMLPGARIVNACRDPLETCFACYRQLFPTGAPFTYDLDDMVDYYAGYVRLSTMWRERYPQRYLDNPYESLQGDLEGQVRRLLDFCELPFDPACLAFHQTRRTVMTLSSTQVREPMRKDTARAPLYGAMLDPLRAKLRVAGIGFGGDH